MPRSYAREDILLIIDTKRYDENMSREDMVRHFRKSLLEGANYAPHLSIVDIRVFGEE